MRITISLIIIICFINLAQGQSNKNKTCNLLIDTYTSSSKDYGIYVYDFDSQTGDLNFKSKVAGEDKPSYITVSLDGKYVYSVNEVRNGSISAFALNPASGELTFLNRESPGGESPCYVAVDEKNKFLFAGNYGSGSLSVFSLKADGSINTNIQFIQNEGSSIDKRRQNGPHVHGAFLSPDHRYLFSPDLGTDEVNIYQFDDAKISQPLAPAEPAFVSVKAGSGPRLLIFHPNSKFAYLIHEMGGIIMVFDYKNGKLFEKQTITMLSPDF